MRSIRRVRGMLPLFLKALNEGQVVEIACHQNLQNGSPKISGTK